MYIFKWFEYLFHFILDQTSNCANQWRVGLVILDLSKRHIYDRSYNVWLVHFPISHLLFTDTDSFFQELGAKTISFWSSNFVSSSAEMLKRILIECIFQEDHPCFCCKRPPNLEIFGEVMVGGVTSVANFSKLFIILYGQMIPTQTIGSMQLISSSIL